MKRTDIEFLVRSFYFENGKYAILEERDLHREMERFK
ncbi:hypothetical protein ABH959_005421 [Bacillus sp. RC51]|uniref:Uncharacterized protein n=1 Tax=Bacillus mycoides TaxID=1405 RepID=A0A3D9TQE2_BACMY|nr:hypothetical protein DET63_105306 [Bacillus sp. DB-2]REF19349.1 hypothetical protein DET55_13517 [Bacillus mycoides]